MAAKTVHVVAHEYSPGAAGSGGFNWYWSFDDAERAYQDATRNDDSASFLTTYQIQEDDTPESITRAIDSDLDEITANAATRTVGANVLRYWRDNKFNMGAASKPASPNS